MLIMDTVISGYSSVVVGVSLVVVGVGVPLVVVVVVGVILVVVVVEVPLVVVVVVGDPLAMVMLMVVVMVECMVLKTEASLKVTVSTMCTESPLPIASLPDISAEPVYFFVVLYSIKRIK